MKEKATGIGASILLIILIVTGLLGDFFKFFLWLFTLQYSAPETSIPGGIIVRILTFLVAYGLVGIIFRTLGFFDSKLMSVSYFIISTLLGFLLAYFVWLIEKHIIIVGIIYGVLFIGILIFSFGRRLFLRKEETKND